VEVRLGKRKYPGRSLHTFISASLIGGRWSIDMRSEQRLIYLFKASVLPL
jgi:hypothetical protein